MLYTGSHCSVYEIFALPQHVNRVACSHENAIDAVKCRREGLDSVEIQMGNRHAQKASLVDVTGSSDDFDFGVLHELRDDGTTHLASRSHDENARFVWHRSLQSMAADWRPCPDFLCVADRLCVDTSEARP